MKYSLALERRYTPLKPGSAEETRYRLALETLLKIIVDQKTKPVRTYAAPGAN